MDDKEFYLDAIRDVVPEHREELSDAFCQYADILGKIEEQFEAYNETGMLEEIIPSEVVDSPMEERKWK